MGRSALVLAGGLVLGAIGCGDSGSGSGMGVPRDDLGVGVGDESYSDGTEPSGSWTEMPSSFNESESCGTEEVISLSDLLLKFSLPICKFKESCSDSITVQQSEGSQGSNNRSMSTRALGQLEQIPSFCIELAQSNLSEREQPSECASIEAIGKVAQTVRGCQQLMTPPAGFCSARLSRCVSELLQAGCEFFEAKIYPKSCPDLPDLWSDDDPPPVDDSQSGGPIRSGI